MSALVKKKKKKKSIILPEAQECSYTYLVVTIIAYWPAQRLVIHESNPTPLHTWSSQWPTPHEDQPGMISQEIGLCTGKWQPKEEAELNCHVTDMSEHCLSYICESDSGRIWEFVNLYSFLYWRNVNTTLLLYPCHVFSVSSSAPQVEAVKLRAVSLKEEGQCDQQWVGDWTTWCWEIWGLQLGPVLVLYSNLWI